MNAPLSFPLVSSPIEPSPFTSIVLPHLVDDIGRQSYDSWFACLRLEGIEGTTARVTLPTKFLCSWVRSNFLPKLTTAMQAGFPGVTVVDVALRSSARQAPALATAAPALPSAAEPRPAARIVVSPAPQRSEAPCPTSPLDLRLTFETFLAGQSNRLAHAATRQLVAADGAASYRALCLHGGVGLGKTHLLQAAAQAVAAQGRRAAYFTAEKFMYGFAYALRSPTSLEAKQYLQGIDLIAIDDVQFLQGKLVRAELERTIDAVIGAGHRLLLAADRAPGELEDLDARTRSRLCAGLAVEVGRFDLELRAQMLQRLCARAGLSLSQPVVDYVAEAIQTNGRDLEGAVNRLAAHASLLQVPLTVAAAGEAIKDLVREREPKRIKIEDIQKLVANHFNVGRQDILSSRRTANVVRPRQIAMYLAKVMTLRSLPEIGRRFGGRDHTTVLHAVRKVESLISGDVALGDELRGLRAMLEA